MKKKISITINDKTLKDIDNIIDNVYIRNRSQAIELLVNNALGENRVAVILSGGEEENIKISETEFRITAKVNENSLIEIMLSKLKGFGFKKVFLIARQKVINSVFSIVQNGTKYGVSLDYIEEKSSDGTGDTLALIRGRVNNTFLAIYGDILFFDLNLEELWNEHLKRKGIATLLLTTTPDPSKKGVVKIEGSKILEFIQKPKTSEVYLGFSSIFIAQPELLEYQGSSLETEIFPDLAKKGFLNGYLSTSKVIKLHNKKDILGLGKKDII
jgi:NDP-sugar pyrophosphorylase family protein